MKKGLVLSRNQSMRFNDFFTDIQSDTKIFDYSGYTDLLFIYDNSSKHPASFVNLDTGKKSYEYGGAYITGYLSEWSLDLAISTAYILSNEKIRVIDSELKKSPSLSKISEMAKLVSAGIRIPKTYGGTKIAIIRAVTTGIIKLEYPVIFKAADGSRGSNNFTIYHENEIFDFLHDKPDASTWVIQKSIDCAGFYRLNTYFYKPAFAIYRTNDPDKVEKHKVHMYKPAGSINAQYLKPSQVPRNIMKTAEKASKLIGREIAGVDLVVGNKDKKIYVLEVNYNPQLVTVESFKEKRIKCFIDAIKKLSK